MGLAERPYMRERTKQRERERLRRAERKERWLLRLVLILDTPPIVWIVVLLLLYLAATLIRPYLVNYPAIYCYVWTDYCLP